MSVKRRFIPGEEWIYLKIYGGPKLLERVLVQELNTLLLELHQNKVMDSYFFIRYSDPDYHIRLRIHSEGTANVGSVMQTVGGNLSAKIQDRSIVRISCETYNREIERYGENTMALAENLFFLDSFAVLRFLSLSRRADDHRWLYSMYWIDQLLDLFRFGENRKSEFLSTGFQNYALEFGIQKPAKVLMDQKYRKRALEMERLFYRSDRDTIPSYIAQIVDSFLKNASPLAAQLLALDSSGTLQVGLDSLVSSLAHMHINRMFRTQPRKYELLIYHFLNKFHRSRLARTKHQSGSQGVLPGRSEPAGKLESPGKLEPQLRQ